MLQYKEISYGGYMSKKAGFDYLYVVGMIFTAIGFLMPVMHANVFGFTAASVNGFDLVGKGNSVMKIAALLIFAGAVAGIVFSVLKKPAMYKFIALICSVAGGLYVLFNTSSNITKLVSHFLAIGFYLIIAGWIIAAAGYFTAKK